MSSAALVDVAGQRCIVHVRGEGGWVWGASQLETSAEEPCCIMGQIFLSIGVSCSIRRLLG